MINKVKKIFLLFMASLLTTMNAMGTQSSVFTPSTTSPMVQCPNVNINGSQLISTSLSVDFGLPVCTGGYSFGSAGIAAWVGGINFQGVCPPSAPYLGGFSEIWGFAVVFDVLAGGGTLTATCCNYAQPPMSLTQNSSTWHTGTFCP
jgi:hypothetical protein